MSTKIYNGFKLVKPASLEEVHAFCHKLRNKIKPIAEKLYRKQFIYEMIGAYDKNQYGFFDESMWFIKHHGFNDLFSGVHSYMYSRIKHIQVTRERDPEVDFSFSISILPLKKKRNVLLMLWSDHHALTKAFEKMPEVVEYHYQNSSDKPRNISNKNWDQRRKDWDEALGGDGYLTPLEAGFTYEPYSVDHLTFYLSDPKEVTKVKRLFPTIEERSKIIVRNIMSKEWEEKKPLITSPEEKENRYEEGIDRALKFSDYLQSTEGKNECAIRENQVKKELKIFDSFNELCNTKIDFHSNNLKILETPEGGKPYWYKK